MATSSADSQIALIRLRPQLNSQLAELLLLDLGRSAAHGIETRLVLREGERVAYERLVREDHHQPVDPRGDPPVRRGAHRERVQEEAEAETLLLRRDLQEVEDLRLELRLVDPERAAGEL